MIRRPSFYSPFVAAICATAFVACGDATHPTSLREIAPPSRPSGFVAPVLSPVVRYDLGFVSAEISAAKVTSVSAGTFTANVASVPAGATIGFSGQWTNEWSCPGRCLVNIYLAYTDALLPWVTGAGADQQLKIEATGTESHPFTASASAPTVPGTYYIGVRVPEINRDSGAASFGFDPSDADHPAAASFKVVVLQPPVATPTITGTAGLNGWYTSDVKVTWGVSDPNGDIKSTDGCAETTVTLNGMTTLTCTVVGVYETVTQSVTIKRDNAPPGASRSYTPSSPNAAGWYNTKVTVRSTCTNVAFPRGSAGSSFILGEGIEPSGTFTCRDQAGNTASVDYPEIKIDLTAPELTGSVSPNPVTLGGKATATPVASDALSGLAAPATCGAVNTSAIGSFTVQCSATDKAGNTTMIDVPYVVVYPFSGFQSPINNDPQGWNTPKAGSTVELTFTVKGIKNLTLPAGSPRVDALPCPGAGYGANTQPITFSGRLTAEGNGVYTYSWKTEKSLAGKCATFSLDVGDGIWHRANFQFR